MHRVRRDRKSWRKGWPWKHVFPIAVDERYCRACRLPYQNGPMPTEVNTFTSGNVAALVYPAGSWKSRQYVVKLGRWKAQTRTFYLSEYFQVEDLEDVAWVAAQARKCIYGKLRKQARR